MSLFVELEGEAEDEEKTEEAEEETLKNVSCLINRLLTSLRGHISLITSLISNYSSSVNS